MQVGTEDIARLCIEAAARRVAGRDRTGCRTRRHHGFVTPARRIIRRIASRHRIGREAIRHRAPHMDLVAVDALAVQHRELTREALEHEARLRPGLLRLKFRAERQEPRARAPTGPSTPSTSTTSVPSIWKPPQMPRIRVPRACFCRIFASRPVLRSQSRSRIVLFVPGRISTSGSPSSRTLAT